MSNFEVKPYTVTVEPHPNADRLDVVRPDGTEYICISQKGRFETGDTAVYVPESAVVPAEVLQNFGFWDEKKDKGMLAGKEGDRVKAIKLRGVLSQGLLFPINDVHDFIGADWLRYPDDYAGALGIVKYEPPIPSNMSGLIYWPEGLRGYTEIENIKKNPDIFESEHEIVVATEKIHGTCSIYSLIARPGENGEPNGAEFHVSSKGQAKQGRALVESDDNLYWQTARKFDIRHALENIAYELGVQREITLFGETFGAGVQDLKYDRDGKDFRAFDLRVDGEYVNYDAFRYLVTQQEIPVVPTVFYGPYDREALEEWASEESAVGGPLREGLVVRPIFEREDPVAGRVIAKFINPDYLTRKGGTELD